MGFANAESITARAPSSVAFRSGYRAAFVLIAVASAFVRKMLGCAPCAWSVTPKSRPLATLRATNTAVILPALERSEGSAAKDLHVKVRLFIDPMDKEGRSEIHAPAS